VIPKAVFEMEKKLNLASQDITHLKIEERKDQRDDGFVFTSQKSNSSGSSFPEFMTPPLKNNLFGDAHDKFKFSAKKEQSGTLRMNQSRAKQNFSTPFQGHDFTWKAKMNLSQKNYLTSHESSGFGVDGIGNSTCIDQFLNKNESEVVGTETKGDASEGKDLDTNCGDDDPNDEIESGGLKSANDEEGITNNGDGLIHFGCDSGSRNMSGVGFTFSAEVQAPSQKRHPKKMNWAKVGQSYLDTYNSNPISLSSVTGSPFSGTSSPFTPEQGQKAKASSPHPNTRGSEVNKVQGIKEELATISTSTIADEEACEKWRLRLVCIYIFSWLAVTWL